MAPKIVDKQQKKDAILGAAEAVFARTGFHMARMQEIATEAGIGKGTIYEYFSNKDELLLALFNLMFREYELMIQEHSQKDENPMEIILLSIQQMLDQLDSHSEITLLYFEIMSSKELVLKLRLTELMTKWMDQLSDLYATCIQQGQKQKLIRQQIDPPVLARVLISMLDGFATHYSILNPSRTEFQKQKRELLNAIEAMLKR